MEQKGTKHTRAINDITFRENFLIVLINCTVLLVRERAHLLLLHRDFPTTV